MCGTRKRAEALLLPVFLVFPDVFQTRAGLKRRATGSIGEITWNGKKEHSTTNTRNENEFLFFFVVVVELKFWSGNDGVGGSEREHELVLSVKKKKGTESTLFSFLKDNNNNTSLTQAHTQVCARVSGW